MKVLFAVGNDQWSKTATERYYEKYGETLECKNVFYFKALVEEVKNNKTYDRIVIHEDLEQFKAKNIEQLDRKLFTYIDAITDEIQDSEIIYICSDRRTKEDNFIIRLYNLGIYNILIGDDRNINPLCEIIKKPKTKREAKEYLNINSGAINETGIMREDEVDEYEMMNILTYYTNIKDEPEKYVSTFDKIAMQYTRPQLKVIASWLPKDVQKAIYAEQKYKFLLGITENTTNSKSGASKKIENVKKPERKHSNDFFGVFKKIKNIKPGKEEVAEVQKNTSENIKEEQSTPNKVQDSIAEEEKKLQDDLAAQVRTEAEELAKKAKKEAEELAERTRTEAKDQQELAEQARKEAEAKAQQELAEKARREAEAKAQQELAEQARKEAEAKAQQELAEQARKEAEAKAQQELAEKARRDAETKAQQELAKKQEEERKQQELSERAWREAEERSQRNNVKANTNISQEEDEILVDKLEVSENNSNSQQELAEKARKEAEAKAQQELAEKARKEAEAKAQQELAEKARKEAEAKAHQELAEKARKEAEIKAQQETIKIPYTNVEKVTNNQNSEEIKVKEQMDKLALEQERIRKAQAELEEERRRFKEEQAKMATEIKQIEDTQPTGEMIGQTEPVNVVPVGYKKMVAFVGANKAGTTFLVNAVANQLVNKKIKTSILDMTRDKGMYYIYNQGDKDLRKIASECMASLSNGEDMYIPISKNLKVYTSVPGAMADTRRGYKHKAIIDTVKNNSNVTIVDADFTTPIEYFLQASEIYIVQDMDLLKMQETTAFLREMKNRNIDLKKVKIIINKYVKSFLTPKRIIEGISYYKDPEMTFTESLISNKVSHTVVPYNLNNYVKYIESLCKETMNFKGYTSDFIEVMDDISKQIYLTNSSIKKRRTV